MQASTLSYVSGPLGVLEIISGISAPNISKLIKTFNRADGYSFDGGNISTYSPAFHITGLYEHSLVTLHDVKDGKVVALTITEQSAVEGEFMDDGSFTFLDECGSPHVLRFFTVRSLTQLKVVATRENSVAELAST